MRSQIQEKYQMNTIKKDFPHLSLLSGETKTIIASTGHQVDVGNLHPEVLGHVMHAIKVINRVTTEPERFSVENVEHKLSESV